MEDSSKIVKEINKLKVYLIGAVVIMLLLVLFTYVSKPNKSDCSEENENLSRAVEALNRTLDKTNDSVNVLKLKIFEKRLIEDSLQIRIMQTLDSLELLENKLRVMQNTSEMASEVIYAVADSIDFYRKQTVFLKKEIARISREKDLLLQKEKLENLRLKNEIKQFEKRLMAIFAINLQFKTYSNGHDQDSKLIESSKAKRVREIRFFFKLSRDLANGDTFSIVLLKGVTRVLPPETFNLNNRTARKSINIPSDMQLTKGRYEAVIYHHNKNYDIENQEIGRVSFELK